MNLRVNCQHRLRVVRYITFIPTTSGCGNYEGEKRSAHILSDHHSCYFRSCARKRLDYNCVFSPRGAWISTKRGTSIDIAPHSQHPKDSNPGPFLRVMIILDIETTASTTCLDISVKAEQNMYTVWLILKAAVVHYCCLF